MVFFPNCKINLGLDILRKREDGYHDIRTVMLSVAGLCDILEIVPGEREGVEFSSGGIAVDCPVADNLCYKAYRAVAERYGIGGVKIHLHKIIPFGAGLGGGSSDAVSTVKALSKLFSLGIPDREMKEIAAGLGSDTVFFVDNVPAVSSGRGEVLEPVAIPQVSGRTLIIIKPPLGVSTAEAYGAVAARVPEILLEERLRLPIEQWRDAVKNDFEGPVFEKHPRLAAIKQALYDEGAMLASMSG
ncbi:MAG: 4-(cytidine 5'-diphospho)-2-C-methyl-D-erythritol kinase [Rikenellaceae bacterium]|nr:4-(cytidine 5'-diphospho)-2-C-methyl-D-erythritol kinase [Rikenellaceae bacterium]